MSNSTFDPDLFMQTQVKDALDTKVAPCDEGEYQLQCNKSVAKQITSKAGETFIIMEVDWEVLDDAQRAKTGREKINARQSLFLDINDSGNLDTSHGKNIELGRLREALGMNKSGKAWSPAMMQGMTCWGYVTQEPNANDPSIVYNRVKRVTSAPAARDDKKAKAA